MKNRHIRRQSLWLQSFIKIGVLSFCILPFVFGFMMNFAKASEYVLRKNVTEESNSRGPASLIPSDHVQMSPIEEDIWLNTILVEDEKGVLKGMVHDFETWNEKERYAQMWNLESTGLYQTPTDDQKKNYLSKRALKYLDKRISGEVKNAKKGSKLHRVGKVQESLKPNTSVDVSPNMRLSFKSRILDGEAIMVMVNPYFENSTTLDYKGNLNINMAKKFEDLKLSTRFQMNVARGEWELHCDRPIIGKWQGRITARNTEANDQEQIMRVSYSHRF